MSGDSNTCSNKIKIGCEYIAEKTIAWHVYVCAPRLTRLIFYYLCPNANGHHR